MSNKKLAKLHRQPDSTWAFLHKNFISLPDPLCSIFPEDVWEFIQRKADSRSTSTGFLVPCLSTTTAFVAGMHSSSTIQNRSNKMPLNLYTIFVGPPATAKSQALKDCASKPMSAPGSHFNQSEIWPGEVQEVKTATASANHLKIYGKEYTAWKEEVGEECTWRNIDA